MLDFLKASQSRRLIAIVPAIIIVGLTLYLFFSRLEGVRSAATPLPGSPLFAFEELYPVRVDESGAVSLDLARFLKALNEIEQMQSPHAVADLLYFGQANNIALLLNDREKRKYGELVKKYSLDEDYNNLNNSARLQEYRDIVNALGQTFAGTGIEFVLHDMRNPLKTVVAIQNPISGSRVGDPATKFGLMLIRHFSVLGFRQPGLISYGTKLKDGREVKSTFIPLYDPIYGLVAALGVNIDISKLDDRNSLEAGKLLANIRAIDKSERVTEMVDAIGK